MSPDWRQMAIENTVSSNVFIRIRRLLRALSIAAYPVLLLQTVLTKTICILSLNFFNFDTIPFLRLRI